MKIHWTEQNWNSWCQDDSLSQRVKHLTSEALQIMPRALSTSCLWLFKEWNGKWTHLVSYSINHKNLFSYESKLFNRTKMLTTAIQRKIWNWKTHGRNQSNQCPLEESTHWQIWVNSNLAYLGFCTLWKLGHVLSLLHNAWNIWVM